MDKESLLKDIFDYYQCKYQICIDGTVKKNNEYGVYTLFNSIDEALKSLVHTMVETNDNLFKTGDIECKYNTWSIEQINFINALA